MSKELFLEYKKQPGRPTLARLLERHQDAVYSLCLQVLRHPQDAEDACQEVLLEVSRQVDAIEEPVSFAGWLYRTAIHTALDVRRKRGRQRVREAKARRPSETETPQPERDVALHEGLAGLDDTSRMLVVEHYFSQRPLRELAAERGCSEVAVWKRIQSARERLKKTLGSAALSGLEGIAKVPAPTGLVRKALGLTGGSAMAVKGGITLAILAPLVLAAASILVYVRQEQPPSGTPAVQKSTAAIPFPDPLLPLPSAPAVFPLSPQPAKPPPAAPRKPYPFKMASLGGSNAVAAHTWAILSSKRLDLNEEGASLAEFLEKIGKLTGLTFRLNPTLKAGERIALQTGLSSVDDCLQAVVGLGDNDFEILPDGTVHVGPKTAITGGFEREARKMEAIVQELRNARDLMNGGWDGLRDLQDASVMKARKISIPQGESSLEEEVDRMFEDQIFVRVDVPVHDLEGITAYKNMMNRRFLQAVEERTVGEHVEQLARMSGLVVVAADRNVLCLTTEDKAADYRAQNDQRRRAYEESSSALEKAYRESGAFTVPDFLDSIPRSVGLRVVPSEEVWDSGATLTLPPGATLRDGLDLLKAQGYRWALRDGKIFVFK